MNRTQLDDCEFLQVPGHAFVERYLTATEALLQTPGAFCAQSLSLMMAGLTSFRIQPRSTWAIHFTTQLCSLLPQCRGVHLAKILSSMATLGFQADEQLLRGAVAVASARVAELDKSCTAQLIWAVSKLDSSQGQHNLHALLDTLPSSVTGSGMPRRHRRVSSRSQPQGQDSDDDDAGGGTAHASASSLLGSRSRIRVGKMAGGRSSVVGGKARIGARLSSTKRAKATASACMPQ